MPKGIVRFVFKMLGTLVCLLLISASAISAFYYNSVILPEDAYQESTVGVWGSLNARKMAYTSPKDFKRAESRLYTLLRKEAFVSSPVPYYLLASLFEANGEHDKAKATYMAMIQVAGINWLSKAESQRYLHDAYAALAWIDYREGKNNEAKRWLSKIPDLKMLDDSERWVALNDVLQSPERADFHFELGKSLRERLELPEARHEFKLAIDNSYDPELKLKASNVMRAKMPNRIKALPPIARYQALVASKLEDEASVLHDAKAKKPLLDRAVGLYQNVLTQAPEFEWGYQQIAHIYMEQEKFAQAKQYAEKAVLYNPDLYLSRLSLGDIALAEGDYQSAHAQFSHARQTLLGLTDSYHQMLLVNVENQLGFTQELLNDSPKALQHYQTALTIAHAIEADPSDLEYAQQGIKRIESQKQLLVSQQKLLASRN